VALADPVTPPAGDDRRRGAHARGDGHIGAGAADLHPGSPLPATVVRDAHDVPHIFAMNLDDLNYTNGYVQAQDRLFEMEILRRAGKGTLSEVLGSAYLEMDVATRRDLYTPAEWQAQFDAQSMEDSRRSRSSPRA